MTRFEENGVDLQELSRDKREAERRYQRSCELCCNWGLSIRCDRCAIDCAHTRMMEVFSVIKKSSQYKKMCA